MRKLIALKIMFASLVAAPVAAGAATDDAKPMRHLQHVYRHAQRAIENQGVQPNAAVQLAPDAGQHKGIPVMTLRAALRLPPSQLPRMFISPNPYQRYLITFMRPMA